MTPFAIAFRQDFSHGRCVAVSLPDAATEAALAGAMAQLPQAERDHAQALAPARRLTWIGGRLALRAALADLGFAPPRLGPLLADERNAPVLPAGAVGSITHKTHLAVALAAPDTGFSLGVDLEDLATYRRDIAPRVLGEAERQQLAALDEPARRRETLVRFAAKEAMYKAVDPHVRRYVAFHEASVDRDAGGALTGRLSLRPDEGPFDVELAELALDQAGFAGLVLVTARLRPARAPTG